MTKITLPTPHTLRINLEYHGLAGGLFQNHLEHTKTSRKVEFLSVPESNFELVTEEFGENLY